MSVSDSMTLSCKCAVESAAVKLQNAFRDDDIWSIHSSIAVGNLKVIHVGGYRNRFEFLGIGKCVSLSGSGVDLAKSGETVGSSFYCGGFQVTIIIVIFFVS